MSRATEASIAGVLLIFTLPLIIIIAIAIRLDSPGPVFEQETCIGRGGRRFQIWRFRTIAIDQPAASRLGWGAKSEVTRVGAFLRYTRIDSVPQLLNVLAGEMSIVDVSGRSPSFLSGD